MRPRCEKAEGRADVVETSLTRGDKTVGVVASETSGISSGGGDKFPGGPIFGLGPLVDGLKLTLWVWSKESWLNMHLDSPEVVATEPVATV